MEPRAHLGFRVVNVSNDIADIDIFDVIGDPWEGITAKDFISQLRDITAPNINLHINSPGGYVNDARAMHTAIQQHPAYMTALIESQAASAASFVAMAADKIVIAKHASMMIHDASGFGIGNASDFRALADILEEESQDIAGHYADRTGDTADAWRERMQANNGIGSTYRGQEAVDVGLADEVMVMPKKKMPMSNAQPMRAVALDDSEPNEEPNDPDDTDELDDITLAMIPAMARGYQPPPVETEVLLAKGAQR